MLTLCYGKLRNFGGLRLIGFGERPKNKQVGLIVLRNNNNK